MRILFCFSRLETEYHNLNKRQNEDVEEKKKVITDLSERLHDNEKSNRELQDELLLVREKP